MVAGTFQTAGGLQEGFLRDAAGNITAFEPLPGTFVASVDLNNNGVLAGEAFLTPLGSGRPFGFVGTVPEPPSIVLLGFGAVGLAIARRPHRDPGRRRARPRI
jgi:hypothetical protein